MKLKIVAVIMLFLATGCSSSVHFIQTDESYLIQSRSEDSAVVFRQGMIRRPHKIIGVLEATLGKGSRRSDLNTLLIKKTKEIGADGVMLVDYDVDRTVYLERHHAIVGRGPFRRHVGSVHPRASVEKSARGIAVIFR